MKKKFILLVLVLAALVIRCSKRDTQQPSDLTNDAKKWFEAYSKSVTAVHEEFQDIGFNWSKAKEIILKNGYSYLAVPITNNHVTLNFISNRHLLIYPAKNGGFFHRIIVTSPLQDYYLAKKGKPERRDFTGVASYWDYSKGFTRGVYVKNGEYIGKVTLTISAAGENARNTTAHITNTTVHPPVTVTAYKRSTNTTYQIIVDVSDINNWLGPGSGDNPCEYSPNCNADDVPEDFWEAGDVDKIQDNVTDPCLKETLQKMLTAPVNTFTDTYNYFNNYNNYELYVSDAPQYELLFPYLDDAPATTFPPATSPIGQQLIYLNRNVLTGWSQEAVCNVICHEFFHAYMNANPGIYPYDANSPSASQHETMLFDFMEKMKSNLQSTFPGMSRTDAYSLALSGLSDSGLTGLRELWFMKLKDKYPNEFGQFLTSIDLVEASDKYRTGGSDGVRCNN